VRVAPQIALSNEQRSKLMICARGRSISKRIVERANILLQAADGKSDQEIAAALHLGRHTAARWRARFLKLGIPGIEKDAARPGRTRTINAEEIVRKTTQEKPDNATHWSTRTMAQAAGLSEASVRRIWHAHGLKPHLVDTFKISRDPQFAEKLEDIVGLYLNPPQQAIVFSVDEKSQIQALHRTQPGLPMKKGRAGTMTHDYKRYGTTTLFAALNTLTGEVLSQCRPRHTHQDWLAFLRLIDENTPQDKQIHIIADNYSPHKHPKVKAWLKRHQRFHMHFTPTSASWLNMVERFFRDITQQRIRRGVFRSVPDLIKAINDYIGNHNHAPKPFIWTAKASDILEKVTRARRTLDKVASTG
jgi:transposase